MTVSRIFATATAALSVLAAVGCSSPPTQYPAATPAPMVVQAAPPPAPVVTAEVMPSQPLPASTVVEYTPTPVVVASNSPSYTDPAIITERAPRADRN